MSACACLHCGSNLIDHADSRLMGLPPDITPTCVGDVEMRVLFTCRICESVYSLDVSTVQFRAVLSGVPA